MIKHALHFTYLLLILILIPSISAAENATWPREIHLEQGIVVIYQPQPEKLEGNQLFVRAAVALELTGRNEPVFGAICFNTRMETDKVERTATFHDINITQIRFPNEDEEKAKKLGEIIENELPKSQLPINLDSLMATLEYVEEREKAAENINNAPPKILFVNEPAVLISIDGEPHLKETDGVTRVINTPFTIIQDPDSKHWYLNADAVNWYTAQEITGQWQLTQSVPSKVSALTPPEQEEDEGADINTDQADGPAPKVIVSTEPTELISSTGKPKFTPVTGTDLLYVSNTESDVLMDIKEQQYYILLSGRWYNSKSLDGPWEFISGDALPEDFTNIPQESDLATVRYAIPGTEEAEEAVLDAQMPQTAAVERKDTSLTVEYDGKPIFKAIEGTKLSYATNSATPVITFEGMYFAIDEAVWFVAETPTGKWVVATKLPPEIYTIPPESPLYYVTFVHIYSYTPEVVYVGYTQGYTNVYVYHNTIVYGTGYWYPGWYGHYYYPRPSTWGYHVRYNPHTGWGFGLSYSNGPFIFHIGRGGWYRGGWWGPSRYRGYRRGYRHGSRAGYRAGYRAGQRNASRNNMYRSKNNQARTRPVSNQSQQRARSQAASNRPNNVYADRSGNVHRNTGNNWEQRTNKGWSSENSQKKQQAAQQRSNGQSQNRQQPSQQPSQKQQEAKQRASQQNQQRPNSQQRSNNNQQQLNRSHQSRQTGNQRVQQRQGGGHRGGGGRR